MDVLMVLIPVALVLGGLGLGAFLWSLRSGQFEDMEGPAMRAISDDDLPDQGPSSGREVTSDDRKDQS